MTSEEDEAIVKRDRYNYEPSPRSRYGRRATLWMANNMVFRKETNPPVAAPQMVSTTPTGGGERAGSVGSARYINMPRYGPKGVGASPVKQAQVGGGRGYQQVSPREASKPLPY